MERKDFAVRLVKADNHERQALLERHGALADVALAYVLKDVCLDGWSSNPAQALGAAQSLKLLSQIKPDREISALTAWTSGLEALVEGKMELAIAQLDDSQARFLALRQPDKAAATQVSKLVALAMLGRYEEAVACGLRAREKFLEQGDQLAAGKIEHNIGNIFFRRDRYEEAEEFQRAARGRFVAAGDQIQLAKIENSLALTLTQRHQIRAAEELYQQALQRAEAGGLLTTQAEIESSIGTLALYQGRYDRALDFLERARRKYVQLNLAHVRAITEQEIADAYLELNLGPEAAEIYARVSVDFARLGLRAEEARAHAYHGRAELILGHTDKAQDLLSQARELYAAEGNEMGAAMVRLVQAQLRFAQGDYPAALRDVREVEQFLSEAGDTRRLLLACWVHGETDRAAGRVREAEQVLSATLEIAEAQGQNEIAWRLLTSLAQIAIVKEQREVAEEYLMRAVDLIEGLRAPLPAEEFRAAFLSNKLQPYNELVRLCVNDGRKPEALVFAERARSRALVDTLVGAMPLAATARDSFEASILEQLDEIRYELNYFYNQIDQHSRPGVASQTARDALRAEVRVRESKTLELTRQLHHHGNGALAVGQTLDLSALQLLLGKNTALVEYGTIDRELFVFVVTNQAIEVVKGLGDETKVAEEIAQLRFQIDSLRSGSPEIRRHLSSLTERAQKRLASLYDKLVRPLRGLIGDRRLAIVPQGSLHYLPFHALHDGARYLIEEREVFYAPSAVVLQQCLRPRAAAFRTALLVGVADEQIPHVSSEIEALARIFPSSRVLLDDQATIESIRTQVPGCDVLHLACHAQFRPDNALFSSLKLGDGWLTVRDTYNLKLNCSLVTLSACETGLSAVAPGEELIGLARGFMSSGTPSIVLSLWTVDDEVTAELMSSFYRALLKCGSPAAALRTAQVALIKKHPHPFFWSPFSVIGRG